MTTTIQVTDIAHLQLAAPRGCEAQARRFFGQILGLTEIEKPEPLRLRGGCWFRVGDRQLHIGVEETFRPATKAHPAFAVADIRAVCEALEEQGIRCVWDDEPGDGVRRFYTADPWGNRLEFTEPRKSSPPTLHHVQSVAQNEINSVIGRPEDTEAAPYYFTYINQVEGDNPLGVLASQLEEASTLFSTISEEKSFWRYAPEKWSVRQVLNHITDTERVAAFRALWFARGFESPLPSYDQNVAASGAGADRVSWLAHVEEFRCVRLSTVSFFRSLPSQAWMRSGVASDNRFTVRALAYIIAGHFAHHKALLRERYL